MKHREIGLLYRVGATHPEEVLPSNGKRFVLSELQKFVGGYIEIVPNSKPFAYCNEDGRNDGLPVNTLASITFLQELVGDVIQVWRERLE